MALNNIIVQLIEVVFSISLFLNAVLFVPQIIKLYKYKNPQNLSLLTFAGFNFIQFFIMLHGYIMKDYLLLFGYLISLITCGCVTMQILFYRKKYQQKFDKVSR